MQDNTKWVYQRRLTFPPWAFSYSYENGLLTVTLFSEELENKTNSMTFTNIPVPDKEDVANVIVNIMSSNGIKWNSEDLEQIKGAVKL